MRKFLCTALILLTFNSIAVAQLPFLVNEQFNDNENYWYLGESEKYACKISNGSYYLSNKVLKSGNTFTNTFSSFLPNEDFEIESKITFLSGSNYGFGLVTNDSRNSKAKKEYYFTISSNGYYKVYEYDYNKGTISHEDWVKSAYVNTEQSNMLTIKRKGNVSSLLINGNVVYSSSKVSFWGSKIGFVVYDTISIQIDYLTIKQSAPKINIVNSTVKYKKENLGPNINSDLQEVTPVISHDGKTLYFAVKNKEPISENNYNSEVFYSTLNADGKWSKRVNIGKPINNSESNFVISAYPDNNTLLLSGIYKADGSSNGAGFSLSHKESNGWSVPKDVVVEDYYNSDSFGSYNISPDGKVMLLSIERDDTYGLKDLYVSFLKKNGSWTAPKNIGDDINTHVDDETPYIAADGKTLYFSSSGHPGYGSNDIFMTRRLDNSWTKWSKPVNLGPDVNTKDWDAYYTLPASGDYAYMVSSESGYGSSDIFRIKIAESAKPEPVVIIYGKVLDKVTKDPLEATISYHELSNGEEAGIARSNPSDGSYKIILPYGKDYGFLAEKKNFLSESDNIDLTKINNFIEIERNLYLSPIEIGKAITLNNVFFVRSKADLLPGSHSELDRLLKVLTDNPNLKIEISGHTDNVGDPALNVKLSEDRVATIRNYLIRKGIQAKRISGKGYGGAKPVASNATEETRKLNRRVEFTITDK